MIVLYKYLDSQTYSTPQNCIYASRLPILYKTMTHQEKRVACFSYNLKREYIGRVFNPPLDLIGCFSDVWFSKLQSGNPNSSFFVKTKVFFTPKKLILNILHIKTKQNKKTNVHHKRRNRYNLQAEHEEIQKTTFCSNLAEPLALPHPVPQILPLAFLWEWREA